MTPSASLRTLLNNGSLLAIVLMAFAAFQNKCGAVDYSSKNVVQNPFIKYTYKTDAEWQAEELKRPSSYFTHAIADPISLARKGRHGKYSHLMQDAGLINGCWDKAGQAYHVDPWLVFSIAKVESNFYKLAVNKNKNHTYDLGMMQINTRWLPILKKFGIGTRQLFDPCTSIFVGTWIVAQNIREFGYNQDGIGAYNSPNIKIRRAYAKKVYAAYAELTRDFISK